MLSVSIGKGRWFDSGGVGCNIVGHCKVSSLVSSLRRIALGTGCARGVVAEPISPPWWLGARLWLSTSIALGSPYN